MPDNLNKIFFVVKNEIYVIYSFATGFQDKKNFISPYFRIAHI